MGKTTFKVRFAKTACLLALLFLILPVSGCGSDHALPAESGAESVAGEGGGGSASALPKESGSGPAAESREEKSRMKVVTTIFPQYDFARQIAGDCADVSMLLKPGEEVHSYEPTPMDIRQIQNCDLFIYTGGENDVWVEKILSSVKEGEKGPRAVRLLDLVETCSELQLEGMMPEKDGHEHAHDHGGGEEDHDHAGGEEDHDHADGEEDHDHADGEEGSEQDHDHDHDHGSGEEDQAAPGEEMHEHAGREEPDEHVWTSPENCVTLIDRLTEEFCAEDPGCAPVYRANGRAYREAFEELDADYQRMAAAAKRKTILFGDRFPFRYLQEELGLTCYAAFSGCSAESEPSAATIAFLIDKTAEEGLPAVFQIEFSNGNIARAISEAAQVRMREDTENQRKTENGASAAGETETPRIQVLQLHSCHNVTRDEFERGETCLSLMRKNLEALSIALGAPGDT